MADPMFAKKRGRILITLSVSAIRPVPHETVYGLSATVDVMFAESLREEPRETGVTVQALLPGATASPFHTDR